MKIVRNNQSTNKYYEDVNIGRVFLNIADGDIYMRTEYGALRLEDGYYYNVIEDDDRVQLLDVELHVL